MKMMTLRSVLSLLLLFLLTGLGSEVVLGDAGDPPVVAARLSLVRGKVSFQPSGESQWSEASVNRPVTIGDRLYTDQASRAELEVGSYTVRLSQATDLTLANLNGQLMQLGLGQGTLRVSVYQLPPNNTVEIDTPNGALTLQSPGSYRVDTAADGSSSLVTVIAGGLEVSGGGVNQAVPGGQAVQLTGNDPIQISPVSMPPPDDFDRWCSDRDRRIQNYASGQYVHSSVPGCEDLDAYGRWVNEPGYGPVWYPTNVPPGWVPYRQGNFVWIRPWGWTWVGAEPWGFVPFHYGRWAHIGPIWVWVPGPVIVQPVYAPALVAFVGGPGFSVGIGVGVQAWFPLGPGEPFVPWYHYGPTYLQQVNVTNVRNMNVVNITNITTIRYANREIATTAVPGDVFRGGGRVDGHVLALSREQLAHAELITHPEIAPAGNAVFGGKAVTSPPVGPERFSAHGQESHGQPPAGRPTPPSPGAREESRPGGPPSTPFPRTVTKTPPPEHNAPLSTREPAMSEHPGRPPEPPHVDNVRAGTPAGPMKEKEVAPHTEKTEKTGKTEKTSHPAPKEDKDHNH